MSTEAVEPEVQEFADQVKSNGKFSFRDRIAGITYPEGKQSVIMDGKSAQQFADLLDEENELEADQRRLVEEFADNMTGVPEEHDLTPRLEEIKRQKQELLDKVLKSRLTFHMRGLSPKQVELITKEARRKFPVKGRTEADVYEQNIEAEDFVSIEMVSKSIVKVEDADGNIDTSVWKYADAESLKEVLFRSEWDKLDGLAGKLFGGKALADAELSADFLPNS